MEPVSFVMALRFGPGWHLTFIQEDKMSGHRRSVARQAVNVGLELGEILIDLVGEAELKLDHHPCVVTGEEQQV
jgi:hypothetical protein